MNNSSGFAAENVFENGFYICKYERCGRKFESEIRLRDHQTRMHEKAEKAVTQAQAQAQQQQQQQHQQQQQQQQTMTQQSQQQTIMSTLNGSNIHKKEELLKLPTIQGQAAKTSQVQKDKQDQLHPVIRQAQQITQSNNTNTFSHSKKTSLTSSIVKNSSLVIGNTATSRPTSSSSSNFNTTSSSTNNIEFGVKENNIMKSSFIENIQKQSYQCTNQQQIVEQNDRIVGAVAQQKSLKSQISFEKQQQQQRLTPNAARRNNQQNTIQNINKPSMNNEQTFNNSNSLLQNSIDNIKPKEQRVKTKEEILFGRKTTGDTKRTKAISNIEKTSTNPKKELKNQKDEFDENDIINDQEDDDSDEDFAKEMNQKDQILNMQFSDNEEEEGEDINAKEGERRDNQLEKMDLLQDDDNVDYDGCDINTLKQKGQDQFKQRPSPSKEGKGKGITNRIEGKKEELKRRVSFANEEVDLLKEKENQEIRRKSELETKNVLTLKFVLEYTGCSSIEEVEQVILRKKNLLFLKETSELDWSEMLNVQFLCVSHNPLMQEIDAIRSIPNHHLLELNLEYNAICDISPILHHTQLEKLYLNGNRITSIRGMSVLTSLRSLTLMKNAIKGFDITIDTLSHLHKLEELELEQNPVSSRFNYKYDILWKLKLKKLDGEEITELDIDLSRAFQSEYHNYCKESKRQGIPVRPGTAKERTTNSLAVEGQTKSYKERFKQKLNDLVQESKEVLNCIPEDKQSELETEIELAKQQQEQLEAELELLYIEQREAREKKEKLQKQNEEFAHSLEDKVKLEEQRKQLKEKYSSYLDQLKNNNSGSAQFIKEIFKLNLKLEDLQKENSELAIENNILSQTQSKFFQKSQLQIRPQSAVNKAHMQFQSSKADFKKSITLFNQFEININQQPTHFISNQYDDAEEVLSQGDEEEEGDEDYEESKHPQLKSGQQQNEIINISQKTEDKQEINNEEEEEEEKEQDNDEYNGNELNLDIGFDSDDLDDDMKEIRDLLNKNEEALKDVKNDLNQF